MISLFAKIFIGFWLSAIAIIGAWLLAGEYFETFPDLDLALQERSPGGQGARRPPTGGPSPRLLYRVFYELQNAPEPRLRALVRRVERDQRARLYLVDNAGADIFGRTPEAGVRQLLGKLEGPRRRIEHRSGQVTLLGQEFYRPEYGELTAVLAFDRPASPVVRALQEQLWLRLSIALVISGLVSFAVSRYLTRSLKRLQLASRALASGDLDMRIEVPERGGDETVELARGFNRMAEQLQEKMQAQRRLLHDVSHELRSPLARLRVALALAERDPLNSAEQLQRIDRETERLDELIGQLLVVPDTQLDLHDSIDLVSLLQELTADAGFEAQQQDKSIGLVTRLEEAVVPTQGDLLKKALENVIRNALAHTPATEQVTVELRREGERFRIDVQDRGPGIPPDALEKVFEPFFRLDESRRRETGGYGLGLSIARRAVNQHGGEISARNNRDGLCVSIVLPAD
jgi:two-component system sensor histidine kinase CpxA